MSALPIGIIFLLTHVLLCDCDPIRQSVRAAGCSSNEWACRNGRCITSAGKCDGTDDCGDNTDETEGCLDFSNACGTGRMICRGILKCVSLHDKCNGVDDCGDNSDEDNCPPQKSLCQHGNPLVNAHGIAYYCGLGPTSQTCPTGSFCHTDPADRFAVCCRL